MLCFEIWRNDQKLVTAGLSDTGVLSFMLTWVGKEPNASSIAVSTVGNIPDLHDSSFDPLGDKRVDWLNMENLKLGDEFRVRLISSDNPDPPAQTSYYPRGRPDWIKKRNRSDE